MRPVSSITTDVLYLLRELWKLTKIESRVTYPIQTPVIQTLQLSIHPVSTCWKHWNWYLLSHVYLLRLIIVPRCCNIHTGIKDEYYDFKSCCNALSRVQTAWCNSSTTHCCPNEQHYARCKPREQTPRSSVHSNKQLLWILLCQRTPPVFLQLSQLPFHPVKL